MDRILRKFKQYESLKFEEVHASFMPHLEGFQNGHVLDIGCGSGRDAQYFADKGFKVLAFDSSAEMLSLAKDAHPSPNITWINRVFPEKATSSLFEAKQYDIVLLSAVLMFIPKNKLRNTFELISKAIKPNGKLFITIRNKRVDDGEDFNTVNITNCIALIEENGFNLQDRAEQKDHIGRSDIRWIALVFSRAVKAE